jgi:hypothetical protein
MRIRRTPVVLAFVLAAGCGGAGPAQAANGHDEPVPPGEPRAELALRLDLEPSTECEERFDLEVYEDRRIELIAWDDGHGRCADRSVRIRYLRGKIDEATLLALVREHARKAEPAAAAAPAKHEEGGE